MIRLRGVVNIDGGEDYEKHFADRCMALSAFVDSVQRKQRRRLVLILDNLDYVCHLNDNGLYHENNDTGEMHILLHICKYIELFNRQRQLGHLGANILFVTRQDSYDILKTAMTASHVFPSLIGEGKTYILESPGLGKALEARCLLMKSQIAMEDIPEGKRKHFKQIPDSIQADLECGRPSLVEHLLGIANDGLRQMMTFFAQYGWASRDYDTPRFIHDYPVGLITFMLGERARFSEEKSSFPNIYLAAYQPRPNYDQTNKDQRADHTYWLKRMILSVVESVHFDSLSELVDVFSCDGKGYDEVLIRDCLGNLTDATGNYCIRVTRALHPVRKVDKNLVIKKLELTRRGKHCLHNIFDRFFYLQLIVEDPKLPIPNSVKEDFAYKFFTEKNLNYTYVVAGEEDYTRESREMIKIKAKQVLIFLEILDRALFWEKQVYKEVFERLEILGIEIPNIGEIKRSVINELKSLKHYLPSPDAEKIIEYAAARRDDFESDLVSAYQASGDHLEI